MTANHSNSLFEGVDRWAVLLYLIIVIAGWLSITAASYDETAVNLYSFSHFYMKQIVWIGVAMVVALVVLLLDVRYYHMWAYPAYIGGVFLLIAALLFGREVNGAKAWFEFGSFRVQPVEFAKIATALAIARVMSEYSCASAGSSAFRSLSSSCRTTPDRASCSDRSSLSSTARV